jgi:hypothetical protein
LAILDFYEEPLVPVLERKHRMVLVPVSPPKKWNLRSGSGLVHDKIIIQVLVQEIRL